MLPRFHFTFMAVGQTVQGTDRYLEKRITVFQVYSTLHVARSTPAHDGCSTFFPPQ